MLSRFMPTRDKVEAELVSDLDALIARPVAFRWKGKIHQIEPMELGVFLDVMDKMSKFPRLLDDLNGNKVTFEKAVTELHALIGSCCKTITKNDVKSMTMSQVNALIDLIQRTVMGSAHIQKKSPDQPAMKSKG